MEYYEFSNSGIQVFVAIFAQMQLQADIRDVFFDLDHTLWDFEKNSALAFETIFAELAIEADLASFLEVYVPINHEYWEKYRKDEITHEELRFGRFRKAFDLAGHEVSDETVLRISSDYIFHLPANNHLFDGALEILEYLKGKYRLHIITNGFHDVQQRKLENSRIIHYFDTVTNSEKAGVKKPNPLIFDYAMELAQADRASSIMIGDCIDADVRGALNCGMDAILFCPDPRTVFDGIKQVSNLIELKKYL